MLCSSLSRRGCVVWIGRRSTCVSSLFFCLFWLCRGLDRGRRCTSWLEKLIFCSNIFCWCLGGYFMVRWWCLVFILILFTNWGFILFGPFRLWGSRHRFCGVELWEELARFAMLWYSSRLLWRRKHFVRCTRWRTCLYFNMGTCLHCAFFCYWGTNSLNIAWSSVYSLLFGEERGWDGDCVMRFDVFWDNADRVVCSVMEADGFEDDGQYE